MLYESAADNFRHIGTRWVVVLTVALAYFASAQLALLFPVSGNFGDVSMLIWPSTGLAVAAVWRYGSPAVAGVMLGAITTNLTITRSPGFSAIIAAGNVLPALFTRWQLRRRNINNPFSDPNTVIRFAVIAGLLSPMLSAAIGATASCVLGPLPLTEAPMAFLAWWAGDAIAVLLVAPTLLTLDGWKELTRERWLELLLMIVVIFVFWWQLFMGRDYSEISPLAVLTLPLIIWTALRFNFTVVSTVSLLIAALSTISAATGHAIYAAKSHASYLYYHLFMGVLAFSSLVIGAGSSALRRAFAKISSDEERFQVLFDQAAVGFILRDINSGVRIVNQKLSDMLGYTENELPGPDLTDITHPDDIDLSHNEIGRLAIGQTDNVNLEKRYIRKDGTLMWGSLTMSMAREGGTHDGKPTYFIGVLEDITQRKHTEALLQGQTQILRELSLNATLPNLLNELALFAERLWPNLHCAIYLADNANHKLLFGAAPRFPKAITGYHAIPIIDGVGCTMSAAARRETVIAADTLSDPLWEHLRSVPLEYPWQRACWAVPFFATTGDLLGVISLYFDRVCTPSAHDNELCRMLASLAGIVVQRHQDATKLRQSEQRFRVTFEQAAVGVALLGADSRWLQVNQKFCEISGFSQAELFERRIADLIHPDDLTQARQTTQRMLSGEIDNYQAERRFVRKDGTVIWVQVTGSLVRDQAGAIECRIAVFEDISERKRAEAEIERLALYDYLTGLPNRRLFGDRLQYALSAAHRSGQFGALLYVDLDNFKQLNDTRGHGAGDELLKQVAQRLQRSLREQDTVARLGGDEFVILLQDLGETMASAVVATEIIAHKIQQLLEIIFELDGGIEHYVTASLGITLFPKGDETAADLLKEADIAMYHVKEEQRNAILFYAPEMQTAADFRVTLERDLRRALHRNEFRLFLQPQIDANGVTVSCEALLRWPHPERGLIEPSVFIPVAEEMGLIVPLGEWIIRSAAKIIRQFEVQGVDLSIAVNVSPRQFREANFVERVQTILWEVGADAGRMILEITEGIVVADFTDTSAKMAQLKKLGIRLSVDDFGTGHSSLAYLKRLPLHELKIDRTFVTDLPDDLNDAALVEAILSVARHLQLEVVAEGVETLAQFEFLKRRGCTRFQGYHLGHPQTPEVYFPFLADIAVTQDGTTPPLQ